MPTGAPCAGTARAATAEVEIGIGRAQFCPHVRDGRLAANALTGPRQHPEAAADPRGRVQPCVVGPSEVRHRQKPRTLQGVENEHLRVGLILLAFYAAAWAESSEPETIAD